MQQSVQTYQAQSIESQRESLVLEHVEFVQHILGKLMIRLPERVDRENLEAAGVLGLVEAAQRYDKDRGVAFTTYAYPRIRGAILDELRRNCPLPQSVLERIAKIQELLDTLPPPVTPEVIARESKLSLHDVQSSLAAMRLRQFAGWHDAISDSNMHPISRNEQPNQVAERAEDCELLADCIERLPQEERRVLTLYHMEDLRLKEIGSIVGLSESRVSRLLATAEFRLKEQLKARGGGGDE